MEVKAKDKSELETPWSWAILFFAWMSGYFFAFHTSTAGILQVEMMEDLGVGSGPISIMTSFAVGLSSLLGPVSGTLASLLSIRTTMMLGVSLISTGMVCASFSYTLPSLIFFYGIVVGLGFGIAFSSSVVVVAFYFDKHRMLANGVLLCSSGFGLLTIPFIERYVIDQYGWRFAVVMNAGVMLHIMVGAAFYFPTPLERKSMIDWSKICSRKGQESSGENSVTCDTHLESSAMMTPNGKATHGCQEKYQKALPDSSTFTSNEEFTSNGLLDAKVLGKDNIKADILRGSLSNSTMSVPMSTKPDAFYSYIFIEDEKRNQSPSLVDMKTLPPDSHLIGNGNLLANRLLQLVQKDSLTNINGGSAGCLSASKSQISPHLRPRQGHGSTRLSSSLLWASAEFGSSIMLPVRIEELDSAEEEQEENDTVGQKIKRVCGCRSICVLCVNLMLVFCGIGIHSIHFPSFVADKGLPAQEVAKFYAAYGAGLVFGRLGGGIAYNKLKPPLLLLLCILQLILGLLLGFAPIYATAAPGLYFMEAGVGFAYGQCYLLLSPIVAQLMGLDDLPIAYGIIQLFVGIGAIVSPIFAGYVYDLTQTFDIPFYLAGTVVVSSSFLLMILVIVQRVESQNTKTIKTTDEELSRSQPLIAADKDIQDHK